MNWAEPILKMNFNFNFKGYPPLAAGVNPPAHNRM